MRETLISMAITAFSAHLKDVEFVCSDDIFYIICSLTGHLTGFSSVGKAHNRLAYILSDHMELRAANTDWRT